MKKILATIFVILFALNAHAAQVGDMYRDARGLNDHATMPSIWK